MIYVASSWRNKYQPEVVQVLKDMGKRLYDFRNAGTAHAGFHWSEVDADWKSWDATRYKAGLEHPIAQEGFKSDMDALLASTDTLLVLPCGRSAHLELGCAVGKGQNTAIFLPPGETIEPELMYKMVGKLLVDWGEVVEWARDLE